MINFKVDDISFYADRVEGHVSRSWRIIRIYGMKTRDREKAEKDYLNKWHPAGYGTTTQYFVEIDCLRLERRNSCD